MKGSLWNFEFEEKVIITLTKPGIGPSPVSHLLAGRVQRNQI